MITLPKKVKPVRFLPDGFCFCLALNRRTVIRLCLFESKKNNQFAAGYFLLPKLNSQSFQHSPNLSKDKLKTERILNCCFAVFILANSKRQSVAQAGVFVALLGAMMLGFSVQEAAAIGIIGGADGPTSIYLAAKMAPQLLGAIAVAAYSYMSLVPLIQPPIMKLFTTEADRKIVMEQLRPVSHFEKVAFPIMCTIVISLLLPSVTALIGMLMLGNLFKEAGCLDRLSDTAQNALMNTVTIMLATGTGLTMSADAFLNYQTILIIILGLVAFIGGTAAGVIFGKLMCIVDGGKTNPLIGSAGVSAVPMAARVSQIEGQKANPSNFLLMHAMGPNVAGVIGSAIAAGFLLAVFK